MPFLKFNEKGSLELASSNPSLNVHAGRIKAEVATPAFFFVYHDDAAIRLSSWRIFMIFFLSRLILTHVFVDVVRLPLIKLNAHVLIEFKWESSGGCDRDFIVRLFLSHVSIVGLNIYIDN